MIVLKVNKMRGKTIVNSKFLFLISSILLILFLWTGCKQEEPDDPYIPPVIADIGKAKVWLTTGDKLRLLNSESDLSIRATRSGSFPLITIDTSITFQRIEGFGAALTGSSAYNLNQKMTPAIRQSALNSLFSAEVGISISYVRLTIGASDFSLSDYTYDDMPTGQTDEDLSEFTLQKDKTDIIPVLKEIMAIAPELNIMGSPWSPPAWMKTNGNLKGGKLKPELYSVYSNYFVKYIQLMKEEGIPIASVTVQNEPLYFTAAYPCMEMQANEQLVFIKNHLGPDFQENSIPTKIIVYDHNWDNTDYAISILNDTDARKFVSGSAFHAYGGNVSSMNIVHNAHPDKDLYFTEISGGGWATDFGDNIIWNMRNIFIGTTRNWSKVALLWNLVLDQNDGPTNNGCSDCRGVLTYNTNSDQITYNEEYYSIGHMSKFVRPGAVRISSKFDQYLVNMDGVSFQNTDGSKVMVLCSYNSEYQTFTLKQGSKYFNYSIAPKSVVSIVW
jgi:glucosylceramidase